MKKKRGAWAVTVLWFLFVILAAGIAYFSFQNGETSKQLGENLILKISQCIYPDRTIHTDELLRITYRIRQAARVLAFLMIGLVGTTTIHVTCRRSGWFVKTVIAAGILFAVAFLTEELKKYIPTRHYSYEEMMLSMASVTAGFLIVSLISLLCEGIKRINQMVHVH